MDIKGFTKTKKRKKTVKLSIDPLIRTMQNDMIILGGKNKVIPSISGDKMSSPPDGLPIVGSIKQPEFEVQKKEKERIEKERIEKQKEMQEKIRRTQRIASQKNIENQREAMDRIEKEREEAQKQAEERAKREAEQRKQAEEEERKEAEKEKKEREKAQKKENKRIKAIKRKQGEKHTKLIAGLVVIFIIIITGIFFYWWNYMRVIPVTVTHFECQNNQCVETEGEGENYCQINKDCEPIEPIIPESLINATTTETIEILSEEYDLFFNQLKSISETQQEANTFKNILIRLVGEAEKIYADFSIFISASKINIPINISQVVAESENNGENYTLFLYSQEQANRLGLVISMGQSDTLVEDLKAWEETIINDIKILFLESEIPESATEEFQDNIYKDIFIRYMNFPTSDLTIDYAIVNNNLVITTSKDSMYAIIDDLMLIE